MMYTAYPFKNIHLGGNATQMMVGWVTGKKSSSFQLHSSHLLNKQNKEPI